MFPSVFVFLRYRTTSAILNKSLSLSLSPQNWPQCWIPSRRVDVAGGLVSGKAYNKSISDKWKSTLSTHYSFFFCSPSLDCSFSIFRHRLPVTRIPFQLMSLPSVRGFSVSGFTIGPSHVLWDIECSVDTSDMIIPIVWCEAVRRVMYLSLYMALLVELHLKREHFQWQLLKLDSSSTTFK